MIISVFDRVENIVGKRGNAGYQHFLLFPQSFEKASFPDTSLCGNGLKERQKFGESTLAFYFFSHNILEKPFFSRSVRSNHRIVSYM